KYLMATGRSHQLADRIRSSCDRLMEYQVWTNTARAFTGALREPISVIVILGLVAIQLLFFQQPLGTIFVALLLLHRTTQMLMSVQGSWQNAMEFTGSAEMVQQELAECQKHQE